MLEDWIYRGLPLSTHSRLLRRRVPLHMAAAHAHAHAQTCTTRSSIWQLCDKTLSNVCLFCIVQAWRSDSAVPHRGCGHPSAPSFSSLPNSPHSASAPFPRSTIPSPFPRPPSSFLHPVRCVPLARRYHLRPLPRVHGRGDAQLLQGPHQHGLHRRVGRMSPSPIPAPLSPSLLGPLLSALLLPRHVALCTHRSLGLVGVMGGGARRSWVVWRSDENEKNVRLDSTERLPKTEKKKSLISAHKISTDTASPVSRACPTREVVIVPKLSRGTTRAKSGRSRLRHYAGQGRRK